MYLPYPLVEIEERTLLVFSFVYNGKCGVVSMVVMQLGLGHDSIFYSWEICKAFNASRISSIGSHGHVAVCS